MRPVFLPVAAILLANSPSAAAEPDLACPPGTTLEEARTESRCVLPDGTGEGPFFGRSANGQLRYHGTARNGLTHGLWTGFYKSGTVSLEANYENGELVGGFRRFDRNGALQGEGVHDGGGEMHGIWREFWPNGRMRAEWTMVHGNHEGPVTTWYESGAKKSEGQRRDGNPDGAWTWYDESGAVTNRCRYEQGRVVEGTCAPFARPE